jgi:branched-chain amino acid transport system permease protein
VTGAVGTAFALGSAYAAVGAAVAVVAVATRTLHLAVGQLLVAGVLVHLVLVSPAVGFPVVAALPIAIVTGAALSAALGPLVVDRLPDGAPVLIGIVVAAGVLDAAVARTITARPVVADPLVPLPAFGPLPPATVTAVVIGVPLALVSAWVLARTRGGRSVRLVGGAPAAAAAVGRSPAMTRAAALAAAGAVAVVAGLLAAPVVTVGTAQAGGVTVRAVAAGAVLGTGRPERALLGGLVLGGAEVAGGAWWPAAGAEVVVALVVVVALIWRGDDQRRGWGRAW